MDNSSVNVTRLVNQFRWRIYRVLTLKYLAQGLTAALFAWGTVMIACRAVGGALFAVPAAFGLAAAVIAGIVAAVLAWRKVPDRQKLMAAVDCESDGGGLLMSLAELGTLGDWGTQLHDMKTPRYRWQSRKTLALMTIGVVFSAFSLLLPDKTVNALAGQRKLDISSQMQDINSKLEKLQEEKILEADKVEELKEELKQIQQNAEAEGPIKTWEAIDHLNDKLAKEAQKAAEELLQEQEKYETAEAMAEALKEHLASEDDSQGPTAEEMRDLANAMSNMLGDIAGDDDFLNDLKQQIDDQGLDSLTQEQLEQLAEKMSEKCRDSQSRMNNLKSGRMIDPSKLKDFSDCNPRDAQSLKDFLDSQCKGACTGDGECYSDFGNPGGRGGQGTSPLQYNHNTEETDAEMKEQALEPDYVDREASVSMGVTRNAPVPNRNGSAGEEGGAVTDTEGVAGSSGRDAVLPKHRGAVMRFFDTNPR